MCDAVDVAPEDDEEQGAGAGAGAGAVAASLRRLLVARAGAERRALRVRGRPVAVALGGAGGTAPPSEEADRAFTCLSGAARLSLFSATLADARAALPPELWDTRGAGALAGFVEAVPRRRRRARAGAGAVEGERKNAEEEEEEEGRDQRQEEEEAKKAEGPRVVPQSAEATTPLWRCVWPPLRPPPRRPGAAPESHASSRSSRARAMHAPAPAGAGSPLGSYEGYARTLGRMRHRRFAAERAAARPSAVMWTASPGFFCVNPLHERVLLVGPPAAPEEDEAAAAALEDVLSCRADPADLPARVVFAVDVAGMTLLHHAARCGADAEVFRALLRAGCAGDVAAPDDAGRTALHWAAEGAHTPLVEALLEAAEAAGCARALLAARDVNDSTPLHAALAATRAAEATDAQTLGTARVRTAALLLHAGADPVPADRFGVVPLAVLACEFSVHAAAAAGDDTRLALLLEDARLFDAYGRLRVGSSAAPQTRQTADDDDDADADDPLRRTPLHEAAYHGRAGAVAMLLRCGGDDERRDCAGQLALHCAAAGGHTAVLRLLLDAAPSDVCGAQSSHRAHAYVSARDCRGLTPLHAALHGQKPAAARLLLGHPATDVGAPDSDGFRPLETALALGMVDIAREILARHDFVAAARAPSEPGAAAEPAPAAPSSRRRPQRLRGRAPPFSPPFSPPSGPVRCAPPSALHCALARHTWEIVPDLLRAGFAWDDFDAARGATALLFAARCGLPVDAFDHLTAPEDFGAPSPAAKDTRRARTLAIVLLRALCAEPPLLPYLDVAVRKGASDVASAEEGEQARRGWEEDEEENEPEKGEHSEERRLRSSALFAALHAGNPAAAAALLDVQSSGGFRVRPVWAALSPDRPAASVLLNEAMCHCGAPTAERILEELLLPRLSGEWWPFPARVRTPADPHTYPLFCAAALRDPALVRLLLATGRFRPSGAAAADDDADAADDDGDDDDASGEPSVSSGAHAANALHFALASPVRQDTVAAVAEIVSALLAAGCDALSCPDFPEPAVTLVKLVAAGHAAFAQPLEALLRGPQRSGALTLLASAGTAETAAALQAAACLPNLDLLDQLLARSAPGGTPTAAAVECALRRSAALRTRPEALARLILFRARARGAPPKLAGLPPPNASQEGEDADDEEVIGQHMEMHAAEQRPAAPRPLGGGGDLCARIRALAGHHSRRFAVDVHVGQTGEGLLLCLACLEGDGGTDVLRLLLACGADPDATALCAGQHQCAPLAVAVAARAPGLLHALLRGGAHPDGTGEFRPLALAAASGFAEAVAALLSAGADPRASSCTLVPSLANLARSSPALSYSRPRSVAIVSTTGVSRGQRGRTRAECLVVPEAPPLHLAAAHGDAATVRTLLAAGADPHALVVCIAGGASGGHEAGALPSETASISALHVVFERAASGAAVGGPAVAPFEETAVLLLDAGADPLARDLFAQTPLGRALEKGAFVFVERALARLAESAGSFPDWLLHSACRHGAPPAVLRVLLGALPAAALAAGDGEAPGKAGQTPLLVVLEAAARRAGALVDACVAQESVCALLEAGADPLARATPGGETPLHAVCRLGLPRALLHTLLEAGASGSICRCSEEGAAAVQGHWLCACAPSPRAVPPAAASAPVSTAAVAAAVNAAAVPHGLSALAYAARAGNPAHIEELLAHGGDPVGPVVGRWEDAAAAAAAAASAAASPLFQAAVGGHAAAYALLRAHCSAAALPRAFVDALLFAAARGGCLGALESLLDDDCADAAVCDADGTAAPYLAAAFGHWECAALLARHAGPVAAAAVVAPKIWVRQRAALEGRRLSSSSSSSSSDATQFAALFALAPGAEECAGLAALALHTHSAADMQVLLACLARVTGDPAAPARFVGALSDAEVVRAVRLRRADVVLLLAEEHGLAVGRVRVGAASGGSAGATLLHEAVACGWSPADTARLVCAGCDPSLQDETGATALHVACATGNIALARVLSGGEEPPGAGDSARPSSCWAVRDRLEQTPLQWATPKTRAVLALRALPLRVPAGAHTPPRVYPMHFWTNNDRVLSEPSERLSASDVRMVVRIEHGQAASSARDDVQEETEFVAANLRRVLGLRAADASAAAGSGFRLFVSPAVPAALLRAPGLAHVGIGSRFLLGRVVSVIEDLCQDRVGQEHVAARLREVRLELASDAASVRVDVSADSGGGVTVIDRVFIGIPPAGVARERAMAAICAAPAEDALKNHFRLWELRFVDPVEALPGELVFVVAQMLDRESYRSFRLVSRCWHRWSREVGDATLFQPRLTRRPSEGPRSRRPRNPSDSDSEREESDADGGSG